MHVGIGIVGLALLVTLGVLVLVLLVRRPLTGFVVLSLICVFAAGLVLTARTAVPLPAERSSVVQLPQSRANGASAQVGQVDTSNPQFDEAAKRDQFWTTATLRDESEFQGNRIRTVTPRIDSNGQLVLAFEAKPSADNTPQPDTPANAERVQRLTEYAMRRFLEGNPDTDGSGILGKLRESFRKLPEEDAQAITRWLVETAGNRLAADRDSVTRNGTNKTELVDRVQFKVPVETLNQSVYNRLNDRRRINLATSLLAVGIVVVAYLILRGSTKHARQPSAATDAGSLP